MWFLLLVFLIGLVIGSFLNCLIYRLNHNLSPFKGRSICPKCKHKLAWKDNIPLLSFVLLRGRCRYCHSPISWQYPSVELATGILTVIVFVLSPNLLFTIYYLLFTYFLIAIFISDLRYNTIPDQIVYPAILISLIYNFVSYPLFTSEESWLPLRSSLPPSEVFLGYLLAGLAAGGFFFLLFLLTKGKGMGLGDVKLAILMGLFLGFPKIVVALYLAFLTGAVGGVILILLGKKRFGEHIPFGPFLAGATWIALFWGKQILAWYQAWI